MSETKKDWRMEMKEILANHLKQVEQLQIATPALSANPENVNPDHPTHSLEELLECPDCYPKIKKAVLDKEVLSRKEKEFECDGCGTRVDESEESCPTCGGKDAHHRD